MCEGYGQLAGQPSSHKRGVPSQLYFAALLRLPRTMSMPDKLLRVNTVISALGLDKCKNTIIGTHP